MNKKRLYKSSDAVIAGVCGGIAEYFGIDPTLVRIIAVALIVMGFGFPAILYVIGMIVIPPDPGAAQGYVDAQAETTESHCGRVYTSTATNPASSGFVANPGNATETSSSDNAASYASSDNSAGHEGSGNSADYAGPGNADGYASSDNAAGYASPASQPPPPDPATRVSSPQASSAGHTSRAADVAYSTYTTHPAPAAHSAKNHSPAVLVVGAILIGVGIIALLCNFVHISVWRFWPVVLIVVGVVSLFTPGSRGWSLERAGNAIVLVSIGLALLAWMLQIVQARVFIAAFFDLWPVLLVVIGLSVIGGARKNSVFSLASSLVLSATIILSLWVYGGLDWASLGSTNLLIESDGLHEFLSDSPFRN